MDNDSRSRIGDRHLSPSRQESDSRDGFKPRPVQSPGDVQRSPSRELPEAARSYIQRESHRVVWVGNVLPGMSAQDLLELMPSIAVDNVRLMDKEDCGYAFAICRDEAEAERAINSYNGRMTVHQNNRIRVKLALSKSVERRAFALYAEFEKQHLSNPSVSLAEFVVEEIAMLSSNASKLPPGLSPSTSLHGAVTSAAYQPTVPSSSFPLLPRINMPAPTRLPSQRLFPAQSTPLTASSTSPERQRVLRQLSDSLALPFLSLYPSAQDMMAAALAAGADPVALQKNLITLRNASDRVVATPLSSDSRTLLDRVTGHARATSTEYYHSPHVPGPNSAFWD